MQHIQENVHQLEINGMRGRLLRLPTPKSKNRTIVLVYGLHSSIERMHSTATFHNQFGEVYAPDLPGFGGMDSFYSIGLTPTLENYADYLYTFLKSQNLNKDITFVAMSFGFLIVTKMLQKYPEMRECVVDNVSVVGFGRHQDFLLSLNKKRVYAGISALFSTKLGSAVIKYGVFNPLSLRAMFKFFEIYNPKYKHTLGEHKKAAIDMELDLWSRNDARTKFYTYKIIMTFDLTKDAQPIEMMVHDMHAPTDQYFDSKRVAESLKLLYTKHQSSIAKTKLHAPSVMGGVEEIEQMYSPEIKKLLSKP